MISQTISHYRILEKLGAGGMGEVYLAQDTRLGRQVALKFLPASYQYDSSRRARFLREARAASALRSPYIAAVHDIGEHEGLLFIVMEYVEGETLSRRVERGPIPAPEAIQIAIQIAEALDEAHSRGIVHRDIKGSNVMTTDRGLVKVLDFGIARIVERVADQSDSDPTLTIGHETAPGIVLGTVSYMSPEQARGLKVDPRTDVFSLGVVMYQLITGTLPFDGPTTADVIASILSREPAPMSRYAKELPEQLEWIVSKALRKDVEQRYQSAKEVAADLRALHQRLELERSAPSASTGARKVVDSNPQQVVATADSPAVQLSQTAASAHTTSSAEYIVGEIKRHKKVSAMVVGAFAFLAATVAYFNNGPAGKAISSLAVLPFVNGGDSNTEYLSDGIPESLINSLSYLPNLKLMSRNSVFRYKGREIDAQTAGRELKVEAVLVGRVVQRGDNVSISAELVDVRDNTHIWGEQYNRKLSDLLTFQEDISRQIAEKLQLRLTGEEQRRLTKRDTQDTEAYQLYLKGRYHWNKRTPAGLKKGVEYFEQAIEKDPGYALAYSGLADCYNLLNDYNVLAPRDSVPKAKAAATKALQLDETLAEAHTSLAFARMRYDWDWPGAESEFKRAIELNPGYPTSHHWYGLYLATRGRFDEALAEMNRALELDPLSLIINTNIGWVYYFKRDYDRAISVYRKALEMNADFVSAHVKLGWALEQKGQYEEAAAEVRRRMELLGDANLAGKMGAEYKTSGYKGLLRKWSEEWESESKGYYVSPYGMAQLYASLGEKQQALAWLEKAYGERDGWLAYLAVEPMLDGLRSDPRFAELVRRVGLAP